MAAVVKQGAIWALPLPDASDVAAAAEAAAEAAADAEQRAILDGAIRDADIARRRAQLADQAVADFERLTQLAEASSAVAGEIHV